MRSKATAKNYVLQTQAGLHTGGGQTETFQVVGRAKVVDVGGAKV